MYTSALVDTYLERIEQAITEKEKKRVADDLLLYYYRLSDEQQRAVHHQMRPILERIGQDLAKLDPLVQHAHRLLEL